MRSASRSSALVAALLLPVVLAAGCRTVERRPPPAPAPEPAARSLVVRATAYNATRAQTDGRPNEGAWGHRLRHGMKVVAVSRDLERLGLVAGTKIRIEGLDGTWTVLDRMPSRRSRAIDIFMGRDVAAARRWGNRTVRITWEEAD